MKDAADNKTIDMLKPRPKTNAERQRAYRRKNCDEKTRLDMYIDAYSNRQLTSLVEYFSLHGNITKKQLIERLIDQEYMKHVQDFPKNLFE